LKFVDKFSARGVIDLNSAKVGGDLDCSRGHFIAPAFGIAHSKNSPEEEEIYAIKASGISVGGALKFVDKFSARGAIDLNSAKVGGDLDFGNGDFDFPGDEPVSADGIVVTGTTWLNGLKTNGIFRFVQADLKQGLYINGASFDTS